LALAWVWGDCVDATEAALSAYLDGIGCEAVLREYSHGLSDYGHTQHPLRFRALAGVGNALLAAVPEDAGALLHVESDLIWQPADLLALLADIQQPSVALAFPMLMKHGTSTFYDIWAYRIGEKPFTLHWPYHAALVHEGDMFVLSGAGSCAAVRHDALLAAKEIGFDAWDLWPGLVRALGRRGLTAWLDRRVTVWHPW
jgi:hypothetical protein